MTYQLLPILLALASVAGPAGATPYTPASGQQVIERLPGGASAERGLRAMRAQLAKRPRELGLATELARRYIDLARRQADPRLLGYAQAALAPWWQLPAPPPAVRLLRATILQSRHQFAPALADLDAVLAADPANGQAWLTRATILTVRGDYAAATAACARLSTLATPLVAATCAASVGAMTGRLAASDRLLALSIERADDQPAERAWAATLSAELAARRGQTATAEQRFRAALERAPDDSYLLGAYCDFLLDQGRAREVAALVRDREGNDGLLLRQALALRQLGADGAPRLRRADAALAERFASALLRGERAHLREQARYQLHVRGDAGAALDVARQNWEQQREPADLRILLEAALAARAAPAAATALDWIAATGIEDGTITQLAARLRSVH